MSTPAAGRVAVFSRDEFLARRFHYRPGEHLSMIGPTGSGKTTLGYQLLARAAHPKLPALVLVMKPRDETAQAWNDRLHFRRVSNWPPPFNPWAVTRKPAGWTLWPAHTFDPAIDDPRMHTIFRRAILDCYKRGRRITFADEVYGLSAELRLDRELVAVWTRGRAMDDGLWAATQKPSHVPLWFYSQPTHLFLHNDPDDRVIERYREIGGVNPKLIADIVKELPWHAWLYIHRRGPKLCIVSA